MSKIQFNTNDVARMLQVDKSTVKRWTDEGKLICFRTPGGHRKFDAEDLYEFVTKYNFKQANDYLEPYLVSDEVIIKKIITKEEYSFLQSVIIDASVKGNKTEILNVIKVALHGEMGFAKILDCIFEPAIKRINELFKLQKFTHCEFQLAQNVLSSSLILVNDIIVPKKQMNKTIVCASLGNEQHEVGLTALVTLLETLGFRVLNLGINIMAEEIKMLTAREHPEYICLFSSSVQNSQHIMNEIIHIAAQAEMIHSRFIIASRLLNSTVEPEVLSLQNVTVYEKYSDFEKIDGQIKAIEYLQQHLEK